MKLKYADQKVQLYNDAFGDMSRSINEFVSVARKIGSPIKSITWKWKSYGHSTLHVVNKKTGAF